MSLRDMSIFKNAIEAIQTGIEDYEQGSVARLKSSVRNVHAGVLLLFKHKLKVMSPRSSDEVLLKQRIVPERRDGIVAFKGQGKKTVDLQSIKERFKSLNVQVDWDAFDSISSIRNEIEHYYTTSNLTVIQEALAKSFTVAANFMSTQLKIDLREHLSDDAWEQLIEIKSFYEAELKRCRESLADFESESDYAREHANRFTCTECYSDLVFFQGKEGAVCRACSKNWDPSEIAVAVVGEAGGSAHYDAVKDGGDETVVDCPECGEFAFVISESQCVNCEASFSTECQRCGIDIPACEMDGSGYCGWCNNVMSKDD